MFLEYHLCYFGEKWPWKRLKFATPTSLRSFFKVVQMWFRLGELDKIATNGVLYVKPWKKIYRRKFFWLPRLITWPEINHRNCSKLPKKTFFCELPENRKFSPLTAFHFNYSLDKLVQTIIEVKSRHYKFGQDSAAKNRLSLKKIPNYIFRVVF